MLGKLVTLALAICTGALDITDDDSEQLKGRNGRGNGGSKAVATSLERSVAFEPATTYAATTEPHEFFGRHLLASYSDCDPRALCDLSSLRATVCQAVRASGATVLNVAEHVFPPSGLTLVVLLSESHASIHTYPEHRACFVDLFTCGHRCRVERFDAIMQAYLCPARANCQIVVRDQGVHPEVVRAQ